MDRSIPLYTKVQVAYESSNLDFSHWIWDNHLIYVVKKSEELASKYDANIEKVRSAALLHDFADAYCMRTDPAHEEISERKARELLLEVGFSNEECEEIMKQIIEPHSCKQGYLPKTLEGKILATADAYAHISQGFYESIPFEYLSFLRSYKEYSKWVSEKINRDFNIKIFFDEVREELNQEYERLLVVFSELNVDQ